MHAHNAMPVLYLHPRAPAERRTQHLQQLLKRVSCQHMPISQTTHSRAFKAAGSWVLRVAVCSASAVNIKCGSCLHRRDAAEGIEAVQRSMQLAPPPKQAPAKPKDRAKTEGERQNTRDWILQYAQEDSDSEDGSKKVLLQSRYCLCCRSLLAQPCNQHRHTM